MKAWERYDGVQVSDVGFNMFLFTFNQEEEAQEVLRKTPWFVMNRLISLQKWDSHVAMKEIQFNKVQFWVQVQGLPVEFFNVRCAEKILAKVGEVIEIEDRFVDGKVFRPFIRARVELDISLPLSTRCWVPRRNLPRIWVSIRYERLRDLCFQCGIIGHEQKGCTKEKVMSSYCRIAQRYNHRVGVPPAKSIKMILEERSKRTKKPQKEANTDTHSRSDSEEVPVEEVSMEDKERYEYQMLLETLDGNGELPSGWRKVRNDESSNQSCFEPVMLDNWCTGSRILRRPQELQVDLRKEMQDGLQFHAKATFQEIGLSGQPDPIPRVFGGFEERSGGNPPGMGFVR